MKKGLCIVVGISYCLSAFSSDLPIHNMPTPQTTPPAINIPQPVTVPEKLGVYNGAEVILNYIENGKSRSLYLGTMHPPLSMTGPTTAEHVVYKNGIHFDLSMCVGIFIGFVSCLILVASFTKFVQHITSHKKRDNSVALS